MVKKTMNQMTLLAALRLSESPFPVSNAEQKMQNSIWRMITFFLGGEPSIQLRYEDILDFPLFQGFAVMVKKTMNQMTLLSALRRSESPFPVSNSEQKIRNSIWRMITFFLGGERSILLSYRDLYSNGINNPLNNKTFLNSRAIYISIFQM